MITAEFRSKSWQQENKSVGYHETASKLTEWKKEPEKAFLSEVSSVQSSNSRFGNSPNAGSCRINNLQASPPNRMIRKPGKIAKPGIAVGEAPTMPNSSPSKPSAMDGVFFGDFR